MFGIHSDEGYARILDGIRIKTLVRGEKTLMAEFKLSAGARLPEHDHPFEQTGYLVSGSMTLRQGSTDRALKPGDSWCIPEGVRHSADIEKDSVAIEIFTPVRQDYLSCLLEDDIVRLAFDPPVHREAH